MAISRCHGNYVHYVIFIMFLSEGWSRRSTSRFEGSLCVHKAAVAV